MKQHPLAGSRRAALATPTDISPEFAQHIADALTALLADVFTLYLKTKNFHWHMSGRHFRDYHLMLDEHGEELIAMTDAIAERARKVGGTTLRSIDHIVRVKRLSDNDADFVTADDMLVELCADNRQLVLFLRQTHELSSQHDDHATTSLIENWIDQSERRVWFLFETTRT